MKRLLFVDDEKNVLDAIKRLMHSHRAEWDMQFVTSGKAALEACAERSFDVVISDLRMPEMDGAELLRRIRVEYPATARLILSGYSEPALAARAVPVAYRVLSKPCDPVELTETIQRVFTLQDVLGQPALQKIIGDIGELPTLSATYLALSDALNLADTSMCQIADIIRQDVGMCAKILQVVNSGFFGPTRDVTAIEHSVSYLGVTTIKTLALYSEAFRVFVPSVDVPDTFWQLLQQHSQRTALIAAALSQTQKIREITLLAALLHDAGTLVLASAMPKSFLRILHEMRSTDCSQAEAEERILGVSHAEIGAYLLGLWGINSLAVEAIAHHHHPSRISHSHLDCSVAVFLSDLLAHELHVHPEDSQGVFLRDQDRRELELLGLLEQFPSYHSQALLALGRAA